MDSVNKTLYIPLYGKAYVSGLGILLKDPKAEEIWGKEAFPLKGKAASKWLAYSMAMRAAVFDEWTAKQLRKGEGTLVLHLGCGMDSRALRVEHPGVRWYDLDFPEVIRERAKYFEGSEDYRMIPGDLRQGSWKTAIPSGGRAVVLMEGLSMYLKPQELQALLKELREHFDAVSILMDCYSTFAARASKYKNPIREVGVTAVYGMDDAEMLAAQTGLVYVQAHSLTPLSMIAQLPPGERIVFSNLFAGKLARSLYRLYEFRT